MLHTLAKIWQREQSSKTLQENRGGSLLQVYLGSRLHVRLQLSVLRSLLPDAQLSCQPKNTGVLLGRTAVMRTQRSALPPQTHNEMITINLGRYQRIQENLHRRETDEYGDYRW